MKPTAAPPHFPYDHGPVCMKGKRTTAYAQRIYKGWWPKLSTVTAKHIRA